MPLELLYNTLAMAPFRSSSYQGAGGTPPYVYTVIPDLTAPANGTIDANGMYIAGDHQGIDVVRVTDSLGAFAEQTVQVLEPLELFCDIIRKEMNLEEDQVYIYNEKLNPLADDRLYIAVGIIMDKHFGNSNKKIADGSDLYENQSLNIMSTLMIDILSRNNTARNRRFEIPLSLSSTYCTQQMEANSFKVGTLPQNFTNLSKEDGAAIPFRFNITVNLFYAIAKIKPVAYYNQFEQVEIKVNK